jgi:putative ABC transport system permease protein
MIAVLFLLGFLVVFLSGFLIINTLSALLNQQIEQIGVMKTFGATRAAVIGIYLALVFVYSLLGLGIAIPLSNLVANYELEQIAPTLNFLSRGVRLVPQAVLIQTIIAFLVPQVAALYPVLHGTACRSTSVKRHFRHGESENGSLTMWLWAGHRAMISLRNTFRQRTRWVNSHHAGVRRAVHRHPLSRLAGELHRRGIPYRGCHQL